MKAWLAVVGVLGACMTDDSTLEVEPQSQLVASWDPAPCSDSHIIVIDLEDDAGAPLSSWAPCVVAGVTLDVLHWGVYRGRIFAWTPHESIRSVVKVRLDIDAPVIYWNVETPR